MIKKTILMLLVLVGGVMSVQAGSFKIYVKANSPENSYLHVWGNNITAGSTDWPGVQVSTLSTTTLHGVTYYVRNVVADSYQFLLQTAADVNKTNDSEVLTNDCYVEYNGVGGSLNILSSTVVNNLCLPGTHNSWAAEESVFTDNNDNTYSYTLSATAWTEFKLLAFGNWIGVSDVDVDAPVGWYEAGNNMGLHNEDSKTGYKSFDLTATDLGNGSWELYIRGNESYDFIIGGNSAIVNGDVSFSATEELNMMTDDDKDGTFVLTVRNVSLTAGDYEYKVFRDKVTDGWQVPSSGNNTLNISTNGTYNIVYTLVVNDYNLSAEANLVPSSVSATLGQHGYTTFASDYPLDLDNITNATAYYVSEAPENSVKLVQATGTVAVGEGLVLYGDDATKTVTIPVAASGTAISGNLLVGCPTGTTLNKHTANYSSIYVLVNTEERPEFQNVYNWIYGGNTVTIPAGKAYLQALTTSAPSFSLEFDDETTGIANIERTISDNQYYTLDGRRVAQPTKGLYIVNGKKVIIK